MHILRPALELDPRLSEAKARIASSLLKEGRTEEATQVYLQGLALDPRNYQLLRNLGIAYTMRREYGKAQEIDACIIAIDLPDELDACNLALDFLQSSGDLRGARQVLDQLISHLPAGRPKGSRLTSMELMLLTLGRHFAAAKSYAENLPRENWETDWSYSQVIGDIEQFAGNTTAARESYQNARVLLLNAIAKDPDEPEAHADLAAWTQHRVSRKKRCAKLNAQSSLSQSRKVRAPGWHGWSTLPWYSRGWASATQLSKDWKN